MKGQSGGGGGEGQEAPDNVEITQEDIEDILDGMSDDHKPGEEQGEKADIPDDVEESEIDGVGKKIDEEIEKGGKNAKDGKDPSDEEGQDSTKGQNSDKGSREKTGAKPKDVDYNNIKPKFNWRNLVQKFCKSHKPVKEETYAKPSPKGVTSAHVAAQIGAAAIKPGMKEASVVTDLKLAFCLDCSGSMLGSVARMFAEATKLLSDPMYATSLVYVLKFSETHEVYRGIFKQNKAHKVTNMAEPLSGKYETTMKAVFATALGGGTEISPASHADTLILLKKGYNVLLLTDTDILWPHNLPLVKDLIVKHPAQMFIIMRDQACYVQWRQKTGIATGNITHF